MLTCGCINVIMYHHSIKENLSIFYSIMFFKKHLSLSFIGFLLINSVLDILKEMAFITAGRAWAGEIPNQVILNHLLDHCFYISSYSRLSLSALYEYRLNYSMVKKLSCDLQTQESTTWKRRKLCMIN